MITTALLINSSKLRDAVVSNFDLERVSFVQEKEWNENSEALFGNKNDLIIVDFNTIKNETLDVFLTINTLCEGEGIGFILVVKKKSSGLIDLKKNLTHLEEIVETHRGRKDFDRAIRRIMSEVAQKKITEKIESDEDEREIILPLNDKGDFTKTSVFTLLFSLLIRKETGILSLINGNVELKFSFRGGLFVDTETTNTSQDLASTIAWKRGEYRFEHHEKLVGKSRPLERVLALGVNEFLSNRDVMQGLMGMMDRYPIPTSRFESSGKLKEAFPSLSEFNDYFERGLTWQDILSEKGESFFKTAYFALNTYLVDSAERPHLTRSVIWAQGTRMALERIERKKIENTTAFKTAQNPDDVERELRITLRDFEFQTAYEIFELWKGCGKKKVRERFYFLVKARHPDVYGNTSSSVKSYAQKIFIAIRKAYAELLKLEKFEEAQGSGGVSETEALNETKPSKDVFTEAQPLRSRVKQIEKAPEEKVRTKEDLRAKMGQLSAMRKKRSRRRSFSHAKKKPIRTKPGLTEAERILSEISEEASEVEIVASEPGDERKEKLDQLKNRARKKNPNAVSEGQEAFREGYQFYREQRMSLAEKKFKSAYELDARALHLAFAAYTKFLVDPSAAEESEANIRKAIEMNDKQTQPDALFFMAQMLKHRGDEKNAMRFYEKALVLNPTNREAERELRLYRLRKDRKNTDPGDFIKKLFKK